MATPSAQLPPSDHPVALVTGASEGLGAGIVAHLKDHGFRVAHCSRRTAARISDDTFEFTERVDVSDFLALDAFARHVTAAFGPIALWINNAGTLEPIGPLQSADETLLETHVRTNLLGTIWGSKIFARIVHDRTEPGTLINISSGAARSVYAGWAVYGATKAAVEQLSRVLAVEERRYGLRVFAVSPGVVDTAMQALIRSTPAERFPEVGRFHSIQEDHAFNSTSWVAEQLRSLHIWASDQTGCISPPTWVSEGSDPVIVRIPNEVTTESTRT